VVRDDDDQKITYREWRTMVLDMYRRAGVRVVPEDEMEEVVKKGGKMEHGVVSEGDIKYVHDRFEERGYRRWEIRAALGFILDRRIYPSANNILATIEKKWITRQSYRRVVTEPSQCPREGRRCGECLDVCMLLKQACTSIADCFGKGLPEELVTKHNQDHPALINLRARLIAEPDLRTRHMVARE